MDNLSEQISAILQTYNPPSESASDNEKQGQQVETPDVSGEAEKTAEAEQAKEEQKAEESKSSGNEALIEDLRRQIKMLTDKISELSKPKEMEAKKEEEDISDYSLGFFKDKSEYEKVFEDPKLMNEVLLRVHNKAVEKTMKLMPQIIKNVVDTHMAIHTKTAEFFKKNEDLLPHREFVGYVANDLAGRNPDWSLGRLFEELGEEVRKRLGLKEKVVSSSKGGFAKKGTTTRKPPEKELPSVEKEILDLIS